jgi:hypothetical protein
LPEFAGIGNAPFMASRYQLSNMQRSIVMHRKKLSNLSPIISTALLMVLFLSAMAVPVVGFSQPVECADDPQNVLRSENCGFDSGIVGWSVITGVNATPNPVEGNPTPGSFQINSVVPDTGGDDDDMETTIRSPCVRIPPSTTFKIQSQFKVLDPLVTATCGYAVTGYSEENCTGTPYYGGIYEEGDEGDETHVSGSGWVSRLDVYVGRPVDASMDIEVWCYIDPDDPPFTLLMDNFIVSAIPPTDGQTQIEEHWESATALSYSPDDFFLPADTGTWSVGDTVSNFPKCGTTPHRAIISMVNGSKALTVVSEDSNSSCADNIWVAFEDLSVVNLNIGFAIPVTSETVIC